MSCVTSTCRQPISSPGDLRWDASRERNYLAVRAGALGMDHSLGDTLTVEMCELVYQMEILE